MLLTCLRKELLHHLLTLRYAMVLGVFVVLSVSSVAVRTRVFQRLAADHAAGDAGRLQLSQEIRQAGVERHDPGFYSWESAEMGWTVDQPPNPLSIFAAGLENEITRSMTIPGFGAESYMPRNDLDQRLFWRPLNHPAFRYLLTLDMVHIVALVCSLLALLLIFDAVSGERERGTLKVLLAGPLPRDTVIVSRLAAGLIVLLVPLLLCWLLAVFYVTVIGKVGLEPWQLARLAWMGLMSIAYVSLFFAVGMAASCLAKGSTTALSICLTVWMAVVFVIPSLAPVTVKHLAPVPPAVTMTMERRAVNTNLMKGEAMQWFAAMADSGSYDGNRDAWTTLVGKVHTEEMRRYAQLDRQYTSSIRGKLGLSLALSRLSPTTSYVCASDDLAGTGPSDYLRYLDNVDAYLRAYLVAKQEQIDDMLRRHQGEPYRAEKWPVFDPAAGDLREALGRGWLDLTLMAGLSVGFLLLAFVGFVRYDPC